MREKYRFCKHAVVFISVAIFLTACYSKDNFVYRNPYPYQERALGDISYENVNKFLSSIKKVDGDAEAKYQMARYFQKQNKHKLAIEELKELLFIDPFFVKAYNALGVSYDQLWDFKRAIRFYRLALKIDPNLDYVNNNLGFAYLLSGDYDGAIEAFRKAIALDEQDKRFRNNLGYAFAKKGQYEQAIEQFRITGDEYSAYYKLGQILYREGNYEMAFRYNEKAYHAKASAKIMSSASSSDKRNGSTDTLQVEENNERFEFSGSASDDVRESLKRDQITPKAAMPGLSINVNENQMPDDINARTKPVIIRKSIKKDSGLAERREQEKVRGGMPYLYGKTIDALQTNRSDSSEKQAAPNAKSEDLINLAKNERAQSNNSIIKVEIEISNGNGVNGMASRLGRYLRERGFKVTRMSNANSFNHEKTKIFYYNGHLQDLHRLLQGVPNRIDIMNIIELKQKGNCLKILIGKDMIPYDSEISRARSIINPS